MNEEELVQCNFRREYPEILSDPKLAIMSKLSNFDQWRASKTKSRPRTSRTCSTACPCWYSCISTSSCSTSPKKPSSNQKCKQLAKFRPKLATWRPPMRLNCRYTKAYIEQIYSLYMSFGFSIRKRQFSNKESINKIKLNFFAQTFENVNVFDPDKPVSTVKENASKMRSSKKSLFDPLEESIIVRKLRDNFRHFEAV